MSMTHDALRLLREEHELQANVVRKMGERVILFEDKREREMREGDERERRERERREREERERRRVRIFRPSSNCAVPAKPNMSRSW